MKKAFIIMAILLLAFSLVVAQGEQADYTTGECALAVLAERGKAKALFDKAAVQEKIIAMKAVIKKAKDFNADTTELEALQADLEDAGDGLANLAGKPGYNAKVQEIKAIISQFREKAHAKAELEGNEAEVQEEIEDALDEAETDLNAEKDSAKAKAKEVLLGVFDLHVCIAKERMEKLSNAGIDVTGMDAKIQEMEALRDDYAAALEAWDREEIRRVSAEIRELWKEIMRNNWKAQAAKIVKNAENAKTKLQETIAKLQEEGVDTTQIEAALQRMNEKVQQAKEKLEEAETEEDAEQAEDLLDDAQEEVNSAREDAREKTKAVGKPKEREGKPEGVGGRPG